MTAFHHFRRYGEAYNCTKCGEPSENPSPILGCPGPREWQEPLPVKWLSGDDTVTEWLKDHPIKQTEKIRVF